MAYAKSTLLLQKDNICSLEALGGILCLASRSRDHLRCFDWSVCLRVSDTRFQHYSELDTFGRFVDGLIIIFAFEMMLMLRFLILDLHGL